MALGVHGGVSTTLTYFVVQLSAAVVLLRPFSRSALALHLASLYHQGSVVLDEIAIVIAIILFLLLLLCTSIRDIRTWCWCKPGDRKSRRGERKGGRNGGWFANGIKCSRDSSGRIVTQFKSHSICRNGTMALSKSNITRNSYNAFLVLLRFSFILFHALALLIRVAFESSLGTVW